MTTRYWDRVAQSWDEHVMCSLHEDQGGAIAGLLRSLAPTHHRILDFGCGVGGFLPLLAGTFGLVVAADTSPRCVARAARVARAFPNVEVRGVRRLSQPPSLRRFDAVLMANVLIAPSPRERGRILRTALEWLRPGGALVLVVPAIESVQLSETVRRHYRPRLRSAYGPAARAADPGIVRIQGHPTKHYAADELGFELSRAQLDVCSLSKVEYSWCSEGFKGLDSRIAERPWDWLACARRHP